MGHSRSSYQFVVVPTGFLSLLLLHAGLCGSILVFNKLYWSIVVLLVTPRRVWRH